jgi:hypothetical protein
MSAWQDTCAWVSSFSKAWKQAVVCALSMLSKLPAATASRLRKEGISPTHSELLPVTLAMRPDNLVGIRSQAQPASIFCALRPSSAPAAKAVYTDRATANR